MIAGTAVAVLAPILLVGAMYVTVRIPDLAAIATAESAVVLDRDGRVVGRIHALADRIEVPLDRVPQHVRDAVVAAEDRGFYSHPGVSLSSILRAALVNLVSRETRQGGSTITQQYVKNAFFGPERSYARKLKEAVLAVKIERRLTKDEILERYLNTIYFGRGAYGIEAASRTFFGAPSRRLGLAQSALLAGMIRGPEVLDPSRAPAAARERRAEVLDAMASLRMIAPERAARAKDAPLRVRPLRPGGFAPYFMDAVRRELEAALGPGTLYRGGLRIETTMDASMQRAAERAVARVLGRPDDPDAALVAIDPATGAVRALVGGRDYARRPFDAATRGLRQPGSAAKPFVLAAALERGVALGSRWSAPAAVTIRTDSGPWRVRNYDRRSHGKIDLLRATARSVNTVFARLIAMIGPERAADLARRAGLGESIPAVHSLALGTPVVSPLHLAAGYATLAARGVRSDPYLVVRVTDADGAVLLDRAPRRERAFERRVADEVTRALRAVISSGTGRRARLPRPAAGKTGTTENHMDAWFAGYTPNLAAGVWIGYADGKRTMQNVRGAPVVGGSLPAEIWRRFMVEALRELPVRSFARTPPPRPSVSAAPTESSVTPVPTGGTTPTISPSP